MNVADVRQIPYRPAECVKGGLALAAIVVSAYRKLSSEAVLLVGGSVGRGDADRYSDLEIFAYWRTIPESQDRSAAIASIGGDLWTIDRDGEPMEHFGVGEIRIGDDLVDGRSMVSVSHLTFDEVDRVVDRVFKGFDPDPESQAFLAILRDSVSLEPSDRLTVWQDRISDYPLELARRVLREDLPFGTWFIPQSLAARGDRFTLHAHMHEIERRLLRVLAAVNRSLVAFPSGKWAVRSDARLTIAPADLRRRLDRCFGPDLLAGWQTMHRVMMETVDLVERQWGDALNEPGENFYEEVRRKWNPLPPYTLMLAASRLDHGGPS